MNNEEIETLSQTENAAPVVAKKSKKTKKPTKKTKAKTTKKTKAKKSSVKELEQSMQNVEEAVSKKKKVKKSKKKTAPVVEENTSNQVEKTTEVAVPETESSSKYDEQVKSLSDTLSSIQSYLEHSLSIMTDTRFESKDLKGIQKTMRPIDKLRMKINDAIFTQGVRGWDDTSKLLSKKHRKQTKKTNMNSGIQKKHPAHPKLAKFMISNSEDYSEGDQVSRVDALKAVAAYVKKNELQIPDDKRKFNVVDDLKELFEDANIDVMGYTQIMGNLKPFFPPAQSATTKASSS